MENNVPSFGTHKDKKSPILNISEVYVNLFELIIGSLCHLQTGFGEPKL